MSIFLQSVQRGWSSSESDDSNVSSRIVAWRLLLLGAGEAAPAAVEGEPLDDTLREEGPAPDGVAARLEVGAPPLLECPGELVAARGDPVLGILPTTLPGSRTNDSVPEGLGAVPSRLDPVLDLESVRLWAEEAVAGESLISSLSRERMLAVSQAALAAGDALSLASRCVGVKAVVFEASFRWEGPGRLSIPKVTPIHIHIIRIVLYERYLGQTLESRQ